METNVEAQPAPAREQPAGTRVVGTREPVEGMSNTYLCELWHGPTLVGRWVEVSSKHGGVERVPLGR